MKNIISISPKKVAQTLLVVVILLILGSVIGAWSNQFSINNHLLAEARDAFIRLFLVNGEANIIAWYSSLTLLLCSFLLGIIALCKKMEQGSYIYHWGVLSLIFLYLSVDEAAVIHEMSNLPLRYLIGAGGVFHYAWIIPAGISVLIFGIVYMKFVFSLPSKTKWLFIISGGIFVYGSLGANAISGSIISIYGSGQAITDTLLLINRTFGESMEMLGIVIFIYALLDYISSHFELVGFRVETKLSKNTNDVLKQR